MKKLFTLIAVAALAVMASCSKPAQETGDPNAAKLDKTALTLMVGDTYTLKVLNAPEKAVVSFRSGNIKVATVASKTGKVTAKSVGEAVVTALVGTAELNCTVTVVPKENVVSKVAVEPATVSLKENGTQQLKATITPAEATDYEAVSKTLKWASSDESVVTVDQTGKITAKAVAEGESKTATVTATVTSEKLGEIKGECQVTVTSSVILITGVDLGSEITLNEGGTRQLNPAIVPADATDAANALKTITYKSSDENVATVSATGLVTAKAVPEGQTKSATITGTVTSKGKEYSGTVKVNVTSNVIKTSSIQLSQTSLKLNPGEDATLTATLLPENHTDSPVVSWETSDASIATVDNGKVVAKDYGTAIITAKISDDVKATCSVLVREGPKSGTTIDMSNTYFEVPTNDAFNSMAAVTLEAWVLIGSGSAEQSFLGTEGVFLIRAQSGSFMAVHGGGASEGWQNPGWTQGSEAKATTAAEAGEWHHVAGVCAEGKITLYVDGAQVAQSDVVITDPMPMNGIEGYVDNASNPNIFMVGNAYGRNRYLNGNIAYVRVWNVARTQEQIAANMAKKTPTGTGLVANWYFTEGEGDTITNHASVSGLNLTPKDGSINWVSGTLPSVE